MGDGDKSCFPNWDISRDTPLMCCSCMSLNVSMFTPCSWGMILADPAGDWEGDEAPSHYHQPYYWSTKGSRSVPKSTTNREIWRSEIERGWRALVLFLRSSAVWWQLLLWAHAVICESCLTTVLSAISWWFPSGPQPWLGRRPWQGPGSCLACQQDFPTSPGKALDKDYIQASCSGGSDGETSSAGVWSQSSGVWYHQHFGTE